MFGLNLLYIFTIGLLIVFGGLFFTSDLYMDRVLKWKAAQLFQESQVYKDPNIDNIGGLLDEGVQKAKIAHLLNPEDQTHLFNYLRLQFRTSPTDALIGWSKTLHNKTDQALRNELLEKCMDIMRPSTLPIHQRKMAAEVAFREIKILLQDDSWASMPTNLLKYCELLAETGQPQEAKNAVLELLIRFPEYPEGVFLLTRLSTHLEDSSRLVELGKMLAKLATRQNEIGLKAIRHMTLLHLLNPLSAASLSKCIELLNMNPQSMPIDFMRIHALQLGLEKSAEKRQEIIKACAGLFDLEAGKDLMIFNQWLLRSGAVESIVEYLPPHKAKVDENLFKLRMSALARTGDFESIHVEIAQATLIPSKWKLVVEARAFALTGHFQDSISSLDRLIPIIESDPRDVEPVCEFMESSGDIRGLCHILEYFSDKPIHAKYSLSKLIHYRAGSANAKELITWLQKLAEISPSDPTLSIAINYLNLLDPNLQVPSKRLSSLLAEAMELVEKTNLPQARIALALAHLRNNSPDRSLVALGSSADWRAWGESRSAWAFLASQVYRLNHDSEKAVVLLKKVDFQNMDRAESESLKFLFPDQLNI